MFDNDESGLMTDEGMRTSDFEKVYESAPVEPEPEKPVNKWALRDRLRSKVLWAAVVGCIITVISAFDAWQYIGIDADGFREIAASVGAVLAAFGVVNDPTNKEGF